MYKYLVYVYEDSVKKMLFGIFLKYYIMYGYFVLFVNKKRLIKWCLVIDIFLKY